MKNIPDSRFPKSVNNTGEQTLDIFSQTKEEKFASLPKSERLTSEEVRSKLSEEFTLKDIQPSTLAEDTLQHRNTLYEEMVSTLKKDPVELDDESLVDMLKTLEDAKKPAEIPHYLKEVYNWAYVDYKNVQRLDRNLVVHTLLFGNAARLIKAYIKEVPKGSRMLQLAHVYGNMIVQLANKISPTGSLDLIDVAPVQLAQAYKKLKHLKHVDMWQQDASVPYHRDYDVVGSFFLLHEVPSEIKTKIVNNILRKVEENNAKAVFVDYYNPSIFNPVRLILKLVNTFLEPFAMEMWEKEIKDFAKEPNRFNWEKTTYFGGVYQKVVVTKK